MVDARLADGSRVNAIIPPLALDGPAMSIRRFAREMLTVDHLVEIGSMTPEFAAVVGAAVRGRLNILVSGGTGAGKTTMLNLLSGFIHWFIENVLSRHSTFDALVNPFLDHHARNILEEESWYITFSHIGILAFAFLSILYVFPLPPFFLGYWIWLVAISYMNPAIHRLCHRPLADRPRWFAKIQDWGLVLTAEHHAVHHDQVDQNYCLVSGHADLLLNRLTARR